MSFRKLLVEGLCTLRDRASVVAASQAPAKHPDPPDGSCGLLSEDDPHLAPSRIAKHVGVISKAWRTTLVCVAQTSVFSPLQAPAERTRYEHAWGGRLMSLALFPSPENFRRTFMHTADGHGTKNRPLECFDAVCP